jgi:hypothetical protein
MRLMHRVAAAGIATSSSGAMMLSRRKRIGAGASLMGMHVVGRDPSAAEAQERTVTAYRVDLDDLVMAFPGQAGSPALPPLLRRFASVTAIEAVTATSDLVRPGCHRTSILALAIPR